VTGVTPSCDKETHNACETGGSSPAQVPRGVFVAKGRVSIVVERCKACGFCVEFCPTKVLALSSAFNSKGYHPPHVVEPEKCSGCDLCGMYCPDFAIYGHRTDDKKKTEQAKAEKSAVQAKPVQAKPVQEVQP
jgi:2-oxoglutarate ferredoxin oxidoreductase subunit delta